MNKKVSPALGYDCLMLVKGLVNKSCEDQLWERVVYSGEKEAKGRPYHMLQISDRRLY